MRPPTESDAKVIAEQALGESIASVSRFTTGAGNWVYDVLSASGRRVVVRINRCRDECAAGVCWSRTLRPLGVPLPEMIAHHLPADGEERAWTVLERLTGTDLEHVYRSLTSTQKLAILDRVLRAQEIVQSLPEGQLYGFTDGLEPPPHQRWLDVLVDHVEISRRRIVRVGAVGTDRAERVMERVVTQDWSDVRSTPFLDDTTTRNVIIHDGVFQGIVDVDGLCFGDPLFVLALTRNSLMFRGEDTSYTDAWADRLALTPAQRRRLDLYTAMFAVNFLGEQGQQFNLDAPPAVDPRHVAKLESIVDLLLSRL